MDSKDKEIKRLRLRVAIKLMLSMALIVLFIVLFNSFSPLFQKKETKEEALTIDTSLMKVGEITKVRWEAKEVAVLKLEPSKFFVYYNHGDSGNCPLFFMKDRFKDVCTGKLFDLKGYQIDNLEHGYRLQTPPYTLKNNKVILGHAQK